MTLVRGRTYSATGRVLDQYPEERSAFVSYGGRLTDQLVLDVVPLVRTDDRPTSIESSGPRCVHWRGSLASTKVARAFLVRGCPVQGAGQAAEGPAWEAAATSLIAGLPFRRY